MLDFLDKYHDLIEFSLSLVSITFSAILSSLLVRNDLKRRKLEDRAERIEHFRLHFDGLARNALTLWEKFEVAYNAQPEFRYEIMIAARKLCAERLTKIDHMIERGNYEDAMLKISDLADSHSEKLKKGKK